MFTFECFVVLFIVSSSADFFWRQVVIVTFHFTANMALIALMAAEEDVKPQKLRQWAESQINFMLGDGGRSYLVGFGSDFPKQPHHRSR